MKNGLLILSDGAYGTVAKEIALEMGCFDKIDILNDLYSVADEKDGCCETAIGKLEAYERFLWTHRYAIAAFEDPFTRRWWLDKLMEAGFIIATLLSPRAYASPSAHIEPGCIVEPLAGISAGVFVGGCSIVKMGATLPPNSVVEKGCTCERDGVPKSREAYQLLGSNAAENT